MKKILFVVATTISGCAFAQNVGINTTSPKVTLDVTGQPTNTTILDGITAPRITGTQLRAKTYTSEQLGTLVFVTTADTAPAGQTIDVRASGYYYFNGTKWILVNSNASEPWYSASTSTGATSNTENIKLAVDNFTTTTITTLGMGVGTENPETRLDIEHPTQGFAIKIKDGSEGDRKVLKSDNKGKGTWQQLLQPKQGNDADSDFVRSAVGSSATPGAIDGDGVHHIGFQVQKTGWYVMKSRFYFKAQDPVNSVGYYWISINNNATDMDAPDILYEYRNYVTNVDGTEGSSPQSGSLIYLSQGVQYYVHYKTKHTRYADTGERRFVFFYVE